MNREFSIEDGFQVVMLFLRDLWWEFLGKVMISKKLITPKKMSQKERESASIEEKTKDELHDDNGFFFLVVCSGTSSDDYFEKVVEKRMHIPPMKQHDGLIVKEDLLFRLAIDFCDNFNKKYQKHGKDSLRFAIDWLEDMIKNPKTHKIEWDLWSQTITEVTEHNRKSLGFF